MALIEVQHLIATSFPVDPDHDVVANPIIEGQFVALDANGFVTEANVTTRAVGLAGDTIAADGGYKPYAADIVVNSAGAVRSTSNRVSDMYNETLGSGKMTVYISGGEFLTDQFAASPSDPWTPGANAYCTSGGLVSPDNPGGGRVVGTILSGPAAVESGVPGTDIRGSITLGNFVRIKLGL